MSKRIIVLEIGGRQSEDMDDIKWVASVIAKKIGGYNEAFITNISDDDYEKIASEWGTEDL